MRVGLVLDRISTGGTERQMELLLREAPPELEFRVCAFEAEDQLAERFEALAPLTLLRRGTVRDLRLAADLRRWAESTACEVLLGAHRFAGLVAKVARAMGMRIPVICAIRGRARYSWKQRLQYDHIDLQLMRFSEALIVNSEAAVDLLPPWPWLRDMIVHIPNALIPAGPASRAESRARREMLGWADTDLVIASVGRLVDVKAPEAAAYAVEYLFAHGLSAKLLWIGDGELRTVLQRSVLSQRGSLHCTGFVDDATDWLAAADIYLHPSYWENTSNGILEAMGRGLPVLARRVGGNTEIILDNETGALFSTEAELLDRLMLLSTDPVVRMELGRRAYERVRESFSVDRMVQGHMELFARCARST